MFKKFILFFKYFVFLSLLIHIYYLFSKNFVKRYFWILFTLIIILNDFIRRKKLSLDSNIYSYSLLTEMIMAVIIRYLLMLTETTSLVIFPLTELLEFKGIKFIFFVILHLISYIGLLTLDIGLPNNWASLSSYIGIILSYLCLMYTTYSRVILRREKEKVYNLNKNLSIANEKLKEYAMEIKDLTVSKERNLLAQELHDSLGHTLISLNMHLEFANKIYDNNPVRVKEILQKCEEITNISINNLKNSVTLLKKDREITYFNDSIRELIANFNMLDNFNIDFISIENLDELNSNIKTAMYKTIKECITNSIRHGHASKIFIEIIKKNNSLILTITNNGVGCNKIVKSNGLLGIEKRISDLNGNINYFNTSKLGFGIKVCIPILMEDSKND